MKISVKSPVEADSEELQLTPEKKMTRAKGSLQIRVKLPQPKGVKLEENDASSQSDTRQLPSKRKRRGKYMHSQFVEDVGQVRLWCIRCCLQLLFNRRGLIFIN